MAGEIVEISNRHRVIICLEDNVLGGQLADALRGFGCPTTLQSTNNGLTSALKNGRADLLIISRRMRMSGGGTLHLFCPFILLMHNPSEGDIQRMCRENRNCRAVMDLSVGVPEIVRACRDVMQFPLTPAAAKMPGEAAGKMPARQRPAGCPVERMDAMQEIRRLGTELRQASTSYCDLRTACRQCRATANLAEATAALDAKLAEYEAILVQADALFGGRELLMKALAAA